MKIDCEGDELNVLKSIKSKQNKKKKKKKTKKKPKKKKKIVNLIHLIVIEIHDIDNRLMDIINILHRSNAFSTILVQQQTNDVFVDENDEPEYQLEISKELKLYYFFAKQ